MDLSKGKIGQSFEIVSINTDQKSKFRLSSVGLNVGDTVKVKGFAPLGDPMMLEVKDFVLAIRKSDAKNIEVK